MKFFASYFPVLLVSKIITDTSEKIPTPPPLQISGVSLTPERVIIDCTDVAGQDNRRCHV